MSVPEIATSLFGRSLRTSIWGSTQHIHDAVENVEVLALGVMERVLVEHSVVIDGRKWLRRRLSFFEGTKENR